MSTEQIQKKICGNCKKSMGVLDDGFFNCWDCRYKIKYTIDKPNTFENEIHDCDHCGTTYAKVETKNYWGYNKENLDICQSCEEIENQRIAEEERLAQIESRKVWAEKRKLDVFPDKYVVQDGERYRLLCGNSIPILDTDLKTVKYLHNCKICKILAGDSKAKVLKQEEVANLFKKGIFGLRSHTGHYRSDYWEGGGRLIHYSTLEAIRTVKGLVIANSQCWSAGWATCSIGWRGVDLRLPLTSLERDFNQDELMNLEVLDNDQGLQAMLLKTGNRYILFGTDMLDGSGYMAELPSSAETVKEGLETLKPKEVKEIKYDVAKRQGDIFFIPTSQEFTPDTYVSTWYSFEDIYRDLYTERFLDFVIEKFKIKVETWGEINHWDKQRAFDSFIKANPKQPKDLYTLILEYAKTHKRSVLKREVRHNKIFDTNHNAENLKVFNGQTFVKGEIKHANRQHTSLVLESWYLVKQNLAVNTWQVDRGYGSD